MVPPTSLRIPRVHRYSGYQSRTSRFAYRTITFFGLTSQPIPLRYVWFYRSFTPSRIATVGLASFAFARHYSQNLGWFLFLPVLRCFSSRGSPRNAMYLRYVSWFFTMSVSTFGYLRISAYLQLPAAFRSLSRPSSAPDAKAFALCSYSLELSYQWSSPITWFSSFSWIAWVSLNISLGYFLFAVKKTFSFFALIFFPPFGEIVLLYPTFTERPILIS